MFSIAAFIHDRSFWRLIHQNAFNLSHRKHFIVTTALTVASDSIDQNLHLLRNTGPSIKRQISEEFQAFQFYFCVVLRFKLNSIRTARSGNVFRRVLKHEAWLGEQHEREVPLLHQRSSKKSLGFQQTHISENIFFVAQTGWVISWNIVPAVSWLDFH